MHAQRVRNNTKNTRCSSEKSANMAKQEQKNDFIQEKQDVMSEETPLILSRLYMKVLTG